MACTLKPAEIKKVKTLGFLINKGTNAFNGRIITRNGKITAEQASVIAAAAEKFGSGEVEFTTRLTVEVRGIPYEKIEPFREYIAAAGLETGGTGAKVRPVVSCKGTTCQYGLYDTFDLSEKIHERFFEGYKDVTLPRKFKIATGGCPNNCVKPNLNDFGVVGKMIPTLDQELCRKCKKCQVEAVCPMKAAKAENGDVTIDTEICVKCGRCVRGCVFKAVHGEPGYEVYVGGRWGKEFVHGRALSKIFTSDKEVLDTLEAALLLFCEQGREGERFSDTIARIGFGTVEKELLSREILLRKKQILQRDSSTL